jgi:hypothetical protein
MHLSGLRALIPEFGFPKQHADISAFEPLSFAELTLLNTFEFLKPARLALHRKPYDLVLPGRITDNPASNLVSLLWPPCTRSTSTRVGSLLSVLKQLKATKESTT